MQASCSCRLIPWSLMLKLASSLHLAMSLYRYFQPVDSKSSGLLIQEEHFLTSGSFVSHPLQPTRKWRKSLEGKKGTTTSRRKGSTTPSFLQKWWRELGKWAAEYCVACYNQILCQEKVALEHGRSAYTRELRKRDNERVQTFLWKNYLKRREWSSFLKWKKCELFNLGWHEAQVDYALHLGQTLCQWGQASWAT